jgi:ankyrin repeat protein
MKPTPIQENKPVSLEQSVRKFRVVEALRSGDTNAISKAIRDTSETGPRASISSNATATTGALEDTTILHLALQCAEFPVIEYVLSNNAGHVDVNARDKDGNTPLHVAAIHGRTAAVKLLLEQKDITDALVNLQGKLPIDLAKNPEIFQVLQLSRSLYTDAKVQQIQGLIAKGDYDSLARVLEEPRLKTVLDINSTEFVSDPTTLQSGGTLLHEAARKKNIPLIQVLLLHGADPFRRDRKGKLAQSITSDDEVKSILKKSPAAVAAQRGIQEKAVLGQAASQGGPSAATAEMLAGREAREMKGYLKKWTNYRKGYQLRWFVLEDGVLSYYKHQDDAGSACRGAINMRIAKLHMNADEKTKFEIIGKSSVKYTLKANHEVEAKRWFWTLNNSIQWTKDQAKEEEKQNARSAELLRQAKADPNALTPQDTHSENASLSDVRRTPSHVPTRSTSSAMLPTPKVELTAASTVGSVDDDDALDIGTEGGTHDGAPVIPGDHDEEDDFGEDESLRQEPGSTKDALNITAQSAKLQLETMSGVHNALMAQLSQSPATPLSDANVTQALSTYDSAIRSLGGLVGDLMRISRDRDAFWKYRLERETNMRRMWEQSMAQVAREQEVLEARVDEAENKRRLTKKALREVMDGASAGGTPVAEQEPDFVPAAPASPMNRTLARRPTALDQVADFSDSDSEGEEEFFDAVDAGEVEVTEMQPDDSQTSEPATAAPSGIDISESFKGYENGIRRRLKMDADDRPKISLWVSIIDTIDFETDF